MAGSPVIGITTTLNESDGFQRVNIEYIKRIAACGAIPILITPVPGGAQRNRELAHEVIGMVDGLLFTGGGDIHPKNYMNVTLRCIHEAMHPGEPYVGAEESVYGKPRKLSDTASDCVNCPVDDALRNIVDEVVPHQVTQVVDGRDVVIPSGASSIPCLDGLLAVNDERDGLKLEIARLAFDRRVHTLGVCRGMQVLNVALGGSLYRDLKVCGITYHDHMQEKPYTDALEPAAVVKGTRLAKILEGNEMGRINTIHHQGANLVAAPLVVNAWGEDGIIEGMEVEAGFMLEGWLDPHPFFMGVQWHPEYLGAHEPLFDALVAAASR